VQSDDHFVTVCRYVERNPVRDGLAERAEDWMRGSLRLRRAKGAQDRPVLSRWPIDFPRDWRLRVNRAIGAKEEEAVRRSIERGQPFGSASWQAEVAARLGLESVFRPRGRPRTTTKNENVSCPLCLRVKARAPVKS
jgi:putative transposase